MPTTSPLLRGTDDARPQEPRLSGLYIYPIKSCAGVEVPVLPFDELGPWGDRRFMVVDLAGHMVTQRTAVRLALARPQLVDGGLTVDAEGMPQLQLSLEDAGPKTRAEVWGYATQAWDQGELAASWFSQLLKHEVRLVRWAADQRRHVSRPAPQPGAYYDQVAFADGYPVLLISEASLADLNGRLQEPVGMNRFRPNLVVSGTEAFAEDSWVEIGVGGMGLRIVKPCARCVMTTIDPQTCQAGREPLATLARYRRRDNAVVFGQNAVHSAPGVLRLGDRVEIIERMSPTLLSV